MDKMLPFENMGRLTSLILSGNELKMIPSSAFAKLPKLVTLDVNRNDISELSQNAFQNLVNLKNL